MPNLHCLWVKGKNGGKYDVTDVVSLTVCWKYKDSLHCIYMVYSYFIVPLLDLKVMTIILTNPSLGQKPNGLLETSNCSLFPVSIKI